ncbi:MAG: hypothetical protein QG605_2259 [Euryarchaeota archaeon]|nr:hypothetical protein [Euryarchaeota archaeon]
MGTLTRLIKLAMSAALANKVIRGTLASGLARSMRWFTKPSTRAKAVSFVSGASKANPGARSSPLPTLFEAIIGLLLWRYKKIRWIAELLAFSGLGALLLDMLGKKQGGPGDQGSGRSDQRGRVIDVDEYDVIEEDR